MQNPSALYKSILASNHSFEVKVSIAGTEYGMDTLTALRTSRTAFGSGSPRLGLASAGEISLSLYADSSAIPRMAELRPMSVSRTVPAILSGSPKASFTSIPARRTVPPASSPSAAMTPC